MRSRRAQFAARLAVGVVAFTVVARHVLLEGLDAVRTDNPYRALWLALPAAVAVSAIRYRWVRRRVHVHDTDLDLLVAVAASLAVFGVLIEFVGRLGWAASSLRPEFALAPLILFTIVGPLFGLRAAMEQVPAFLVVGCAWPFPYVVESAFVPLQSLVWVIVATLLATSATALVRWPARLGLPAAVGGNLVAVLVCARTTTGALAVPAALAVVVGLRTVTRRPWVWQEGRRPDPEQPSGWPRKRFGIPFVLSVAFLAGLVPSSGLRGTDAASAAERPVDTCTRLPGWTLVARRSIGGGPDRNAGDWRIGRCEYAVTVDGRDERVFVDVSEPVSWVELGAFPTPTVLAPGGVLDPLTLDLRIGGSDATRYVWHRPSFGGAVVVVSWHTRVSDDRWQRIEVIVASTTPKVPEPGVRPRPLSVVVDRVGMVLRTQVAEAARYEVVVAEEAVAVRLARDLARAPVP